jgi:hypothetical protein
MRRQAVYVALLIASIILADTARADPDKLPTTFDTFPGDFHKAALKLDLPDLPIFKDLSELPMFKGLKAFKDLPNITKLPCPPAAAERLTCVYKAGDLAILYASVDKGGTDVTKITIICRADVHRCIDIYIVGLSFLAVVDAPKERQILTFLFEGLRVGNETRIVTDDRKFILQQSVAAGIWFFIEAANSDD